MALTFNTLLANLNQMGFYDFVLPWMLFLIIIFAVLQKTKLPTDNQQFQIVISVILAFFIVNYVPYGVGFGTYLTTLFGSASIYIAGGLVLLLFLGVVGLDVSGSIGKNKIVLGILVAILAVMVFLGAGGQTLNISDQTATLLFMVALMGGAVLLLGSKSSAEKPGEH